jgi:DNA helicase-2/ATP-dependent DNA helicase PcrA
MVTDSLLDGLDPAQLAAVTEPTNPLCILARAGSGKTRVLTRRIAWRAEQGDLDIRRVLAITFTNRAAGELRDRLGRLVGRDVGTTGTFHAVAYQQLRDLWSQHGRAEPALLDRKSRMVSRLLPSSFPLRPNTVVAEIDWAQARDVSPDDYVAQAALAERQVPIDPARIAEVYRAYVDEKRHRHVVDFDDLLAECTRAMRESPEFARSQRWRFRHLFVDEYQDVNLLQQRLLDAWLGDRDDLCVVGDPNQAIYRWNGADASHLVDFVAHHPGAVVHELATNHRSAPAVVRVADAVLAPTRHRPIAGAQLPTVTACRDAEAEAVTVARAVRTARAPGSPWRHQAVLVRTNAQAEAIAEVLDRVGIPNRIRGRGTFLDEPTVRDALRSASRSHLGLAAWLEDLTERDLTERDDEALGTLAEFGAQLLAAQPAAPATALPGWITATVREDVSPARDAVDVLSFHAAKGLEWPIVHLAGIEEGYVPSAKVRDPAALAEEQRLLYVAASRAGRQLHVTWARSRRFGSRDVARSPSRWLGAIEQAIADLGPPPLARPSPPVPHESAAPEPAPVRDASGRLDDWRRRVARAASVPPAVVLPDDVLARVVAAAPRGLDELVAIRGLGRIKAERYGDEMLAALGDEPA